MLIFRVLDFAPIFTCYFNFLFLGRRGRKEEEETSQAFAYLLSLTHARTHPSIDRGSIAISTSSQVLTYFFLLPPSIFTALQLLPSLSLSHAFVGFLSCHRWSFFSDRNSCFLLALCPIIHDFQGISCIIMCVLCSLKIRTKASLVSSTVEEHRKQKT